MQKATRVAFLFPSLACCGAPGERMGCRVPGVPGRAKAHLLAPATRGKGALLSVRTGGVTHLEIQ